MAPIRTIFDKFGDCCQKVNSPHKYMTIDKIIFAFRGRCGFRVYTFYNSTKA